MGIPNLTLRGSTYWGRRHISVAIANNSDVEAAAPESVFLKSSTHPRA